LVGIRKKFKWKKMNFTTDLPKRNPLVSYCEKYYPSEEIEAQKSKKDGPVYRMHAVILTARDR